MCGCTVSFLTGTNLIIISKDNVSRVLSKKDAFVDVIVGQFRVWCQASLSTGTQCRKVSRESIVAIIMTNQQHSLDECNTFAVDPVLAIMSKYMMKFF